jgi:hypothetical protein
MQQRHICVESSRNGECLSGGHRAHPQHQEKRQPIGEELSRLLAASFVKEIRHLDWIANPFLVPKKNGKWRMCVNYTSLNKACLKYPFPLPRIDQVIDLTAGCELLSFLDAYSGYHQIPLAEADQPTTTLITPFGYFCYLKMLFGLKIVGAMLALIRH